MAIIQTYKLYRAIIADLRRVCPPAFAVSVRRVKLSNYEGRCWKHGKKFYIQIDSRLDEARAIDVLLHEWAHACAWNHKLDAAVSDEDFNRLSHDAAWGVAYSEVYAAYERFVTSPPVK
jgi:hypothetical protein